MASNIEQGLDAIISSGGISSGGSISSGGRNRRRGNAKGGVSKASGGSSTKTLGKALAAASKTNKKQKAKASGSAAATAAAAFDPLANAKRVVVSNLPRDVDEAAVRQFFQDSIGKIRNIKGTYNANGSPTGTYTITFEKPGSAKKISDKFHNEPIDGGKARLSVQILIDATAVPPKPLADRIGVKPEAAAPNSKPKANKRKGNAAKSADGPIKAVQKPANANPKNKTKKTKKQPAKKPAPRSAAELDAEMSDYFASADRNEISV